MQAMKWIQEISRHSPRPDKVTREMVQATKNQRLLIRGSVRLMTGSVLTSDEIEARREENNRSIIG